MEKNKDFFKFNNFLKDYFHASEDMRYINFYLYIIVKFLRIIKI